MVHPQNPHIGPPPGAALLHRLGGHVEHPHKADGAAGHPAGGFDGAAAGAQPGEGALNDILDGIMDVFSVDSEDRKGEADATPDEEENATAPAAEQPERQ